MKAVGVKVLKNKLSEYVRLAESGETVLVTDRDRVVAELGPRPPGRAPRLADALLAEAVREGWMTAPLIVARGRPRQPVATWNKLSRELDFDGVTGDLPRHVGRARPPAVGGSTAARLPVAAAARRQPAARVRALDTARRAAPRRLYGEMARRLLERLAILELAPNVLARAVEPFPAPVRTLDALHLAAIEFLRGRGQTIELASYDERLISVAARELGIRSRRSDASKGLVLRGLRC